ARDNGGVIDVGECGHCGARQAAIAAHTHALEVGQEPTRHGGVEVLVGGTIQANDGERSGRRKVVAAVKRESVVSGSGHRQLIFTPISRMVSAIAAKSARMSASKMRPMEPMRNVSA